MKRIRMNIAPANGHSFTEVDGAVLEARSWVGLIRKVRGYRRRNGRLMSDPIQEVFAQACNRYPELCYDSDEDMPRPNPVSLKGRVFAWLAGLKRQKDAGKAIALVVPSVAQTRQNICLRCPQISQVGRGCATCKGALNGLRSSLIGNRSPRNPRVGACSVLGIDLPVATNLEEPALDEPQLPQHCWRRRS